MRAIQQGFVQMRDVKVERVKLLEEIKKNREKHIKEYKEALKNYRDLAKDKINSAMTKAAKDLERNSKMLLSKVKEMSDDDIAEGPGDVVCILQNVSFNLKVPENHEEDYDAVISMLEMSVDEHIQLRSDEHQCYVMDKWDWKQDFQKLSTEYMLSNSRKR